MRKRCEQLPGMPTELRDIRLLVSVEEAAVMMSIGRSTMYDLVMRHEVFSVKVGRVRRIPFQALQDYVGRLMTERAS